MAISEVGEWAADKLDRLEKYLHAYTTIMKSQSWCEGFYYFDAFAGPGEHEVRTIKADSKSTKGLLYEIASHGQEQDEQKAYLAGSPRVALDLKVPFSAYVFVEKNAERIAELEKLRDEYGDTRKILIREGDCNEYLIERVANNPDINWKRNRAVVFLDPFGMQVKWSTLEALGETKAIEVFLNLPVGMAIQRLLKRDPNNFTQRERNALDDYFGSPEWFDELYPSHQTLFGEQTEKVTRSGKKLALWYRNRLKALFGYTSKAALIRNTHGGHLYYLLLGTPSKTGAKIASYIMKGGESI